MIELHTLILFFQSYGYASVFGVLLLCGFGLPIPEDISLVAGGIISGLGYTNPWIMFIVSMAGVLIGDSIMFFFGRIIGKKINQKGYSSKVLPKARYEKIQGWHAKYGRMLIFAARFMPGLRSPIFAATGALRTVSYATFILIDGFAALISVPVWIFLGYTGANNRKWLMEVISTSHTALIIIISAAAVFFIVKYLIKKKMSSIG